MISQYGNRLFLVSSASLLFAPLISLAVKGLSRGNILMEDLSQGLFSLPLEAIELPWHAPELCLVTTPFLYSLNPSLI